MSFSRLHKLITYLIAGLGLYALTLGGDLGALVTAGLGLAFVVSIFVEEPVLSRPGYMRGWTIAVVVLLAAQIVRGLLGSALLPLGLEFAGFLQISRLFNRRTARDHQQIVVLAFVHLIGATVLTSEMTYGLVFVAFLVAAPWMLTLSHLRREIEGNYPGVVQRRAPDVQRILGSKRVVGPRFLLGTAVLTVPIFIATLGFFLLFPRVGLGLLSFGGGGGQYTAGFGSDVELGGFGTIRDNPQVVLRFRPSGVTNPPAQRTTRFRGTSFDTYDGTRWSRELRSSRGETVRHFEGYIPLDGWPEPDGPTIDVDLDYLDESVIFLPPNTKGITLSGRVEAGLLEIQTVTQSSGYDFRYSDDLDIGVSYTAHLSSRALPLDEGPLSAEEQAIYTAIPANYDRIGELAEEVFESSRTPRERADAALSYLQRSGEFRYTLDQPDTSGRDPLEVFLFDAKAGHCEYFSTAMAVMLRSAGVPTRNVTGFVGGTFNSYGEYYAVTQGDAHSWVEVYLDGAWVTYDPTPSGEGFAPRAGMMHELRSLLDAAHVRWARDVVGYDLRKQAEGARSLLRWLRGSESNQREEATNTSANTTSTTSPLVFLALGAILLGLLIWYLRSRKKTTRSTAERRAANLYEYLERRLEKCGFPRPAYRTPSEHLRRLEQEEFPHLGLAREVTQVYLAARFGEVVLAAETVRGLRARIREIAPAKGAKRQGAH